MKTAAQLAQEGYLSSVKYMDIRNKDISEISSDNMAKLTSIVTDRVVIDEMTPVSHLSPILASVQSIGLWLGDMSLSEENTRALVTAMRTRVQYVILGWRVTFDPELLLDYDGQGYCFKLQVWGDTRTKYGARLIRWAGDKDWRVTEDEDGLLMEKKY